MKKSGPRSQRRKNGPPRKSEAALSRVAGLPAVAAVFARSPGRVERLFFDEQLKPMTEAFCTQMAKARKPYRLVPADELARIAGTPMHGGIVAVVGAKEIPPLDPAQAQKWAADGAPLLILDGVSNPHNLGAIARTAAFFGVPRMVLSGHPAQAGLSDASYRVAEGGLDYIDLYRASDLATAIKKLGQFYHVIGTALGAYTKLPALKPPRGKPPALVLGNEEEGVPPATLKACSEIVIIPGVGQIQSLNVSASAAILLYEITSRQPGKLA